MNTGWVEQAVKGHGTGNDFVVLPDPQGRLRLRPDLVRALCDRHTGIGADGVLRVVRSSEDAESASMAADAPWFMDYRNADGSLSEMCGNGIRVFVRYLQRAGLVTNDEVAVATRGGIRRTWVHDAGIEVDMGRPQLLPDPVRVTVRGLGQRAGTALRMPNPHVVVAMTDRQALEGLDLHDSPAVEPSLTEGQNVEFVVRSGTRGLRMRVHERGVGETLSCGTGMCAVVVATAVADGSIGDDTVWHVDPPGGRCLVRWRPDGSVRLTGPAVLVADIRLDSDWVSASGG